MAKKNIIPGNTLETIEVYKHYESGKTRKRGAFIKFRSHDGKLYWQLKVNGEVVWQTPYRDLTSKLAGKKALRSLVECAALIPKDRL